ncbi:hypothetical protein [Streptomyces sp. UNOC14_S4]|uniref:hypothetical protein n=1 Tax=Streptomyces sp. UNOC14_S4 TaxID=2872340 RepID=UPI001E295268|nr:hypothetical protein [Streptomyces sp. UNOC14_S4]MCC3766382.1 hypothetical protein [Streptomyces sp. UNOC14_S4]
MTSVHSPTRRTALTALSAFVLIVGFLFAVPQRGFATGPKPSPSAPTPAVAKPAPEKKPSSRALTNTNPVTYHGGKVQNAPQVYVVWWGNQWSQGNNDPKNELFLQARFFDSLYGAGDNWSTSATQYCSGITSGSKDCSHAVTFVGHPASSPRVGQWDEESAAAPQNPTTTDIVNEGIKAAQYFGVSDTNSQIIIDTPPGVVPSGFKTQYCAWHTSVNLTGGGQITVTNMPYMPDAGATCGASSVPVGTTGVNADNEGVTIVGGHEYGETLTDPVPITGWTDDTGGTGETADKCAWTSMGIVSLNGNKFAVQPLWSNNANSGSGGCVKYYNSAASQG